MTHIIKNNKWVIATFLISVLLGIFTFFTFVNQNSLKFTNLNLQILLYVDALVLLVFFVLIIKESFKFFADRKNKKIGSETRLKYILFFSTTTLLPAILISVFSLFLFNVVLQKYFEKRIKSVINGSAEVATSYIKQTRNSIESDILLVMFDINRKSSLYYENPKRFLNILTSQRMLRKLDEIYLLDSAGNIIISNILDNTLEFVPPPEEAFDLSLDGNPIRIIDPKTNRSSALVKLNNFIDTYLYIVKFMDPKIINFLVEADRGASFYYMIQDRKTGIKITFALIYLIIVSLLLFVSLSIAIRFSSRLTNPIINLIGASEKISAGDLDAKVPQISTDNEFKKLNENFNSMIDKLKKQQDKLLLSERHEAWESVARKLAHEIKNPLTPIQLSIDLIREKYLHKVNDEGKKFTTYLNTMTKQIKDIEHLVTEFSDFARMPKPILKKIDLITIVKRSLVLHDFSEKDIKFTFSPNKSSYLIKADEEQLNRVFINLVKNSIESIHDKGSKIADFKGKINIDINDDRDYIYVNIIDNGIGFSKVDKKKMLTPYFTTKKKGTGLGLAVVSKIINDHNGVILFNSTDDGAKVEISIPQI